MPGNIEFPCIFQLMATGVGNRAAICCGCARYLDRSSGDSDPALSPFATQFVCRKPMLCSQSKYVNILIFSTFFLKLILVAL